MRQWIGLFVLSALCAAGVFGAPSIPPVGGGSTGACEWRPDIQTSGDYEVQVYYPEGSNRAPDAPFTVRHTGGASTVTVDQTANGGAWLSLGTFNFATGTSGSVELQNNAGGSVVIADAVKFVFIQATTTPPPSGSGDSGGGGSDGGCVSRNGGSSAWMMLVLMISLAGIPVLSRRTA